MSSTMTTPIGRCTPLTAISIPPFSARAIALSPLLMMVPKRYLYHLTHSLTCSNMQLLC
ncbi:hypothetical protein LINPERHAP1_LOCUS30380 [Linum perenne]